MKVIVLSGLPGCGKSTLANSSLQSEMNKDYLNDWSIINQDTLGDRHACIKKFHELAHNGINIIIDRTNVNKKQRKIWIDLARQYKAESVECIYIHLDKDKCVERIDKRENHLTIKKSDSFEKKQAIVYRFYDDLELPSLNEDFDKIIFIRG